MTPFQFFDLLAAAFRAMRPEPQKPEPKRPSWHTIIDMRARDNG